MESIEFSSTSNEKIEYFFSFSFFFFFFFRKILLARNDDIIESIDRCQLLSLSLSLFSLSFLFFSSTSTISPVLSPREIGSRSNWNESTRKEHAPRHFYPRFLPRSTATRHRENSISSQQFLDGAAPPPPLPLR